MKIVILWGRAAAEEKEPPENSGSFQLLLEKDRFSPVGSEVGCSLRPKDSDSRVTSLPIQDAAEAGSRSGYRGRRSPHTPHERFEGLTVLKAAQVREETPMPWSDAQSWRRGYAGGWAPGPGLLLWRGSSESL